MENPPPRNGRPRDSLTLPFDALIGVVKEEVNRRNSFAPTWDDPSVDEDD